MKGTLTISSKIPEQEFMETMLNMKHSGYVCEPVFLFYALGKSWHIDTFTYYFKLLELEKLNKNSDFKKKFQWKSRGVKNAKIN